MKARNLLWYCCFAFGFSFAQTDISSLEYFFDVDPGYGNGTSIDINPGVAVLDQSFSVTTTGLPVGTHRLFIRAINVDGTASLLEHKTFRVAHAPGINISDLVEAEYFFNQDPGVGMGTAIDVVDGVVVDETLSVPTGSLSVGTHRLYVRTKNASNEYSLYEHKTFRVAHAPGNNISDLVEAEYFFNQDPGIGVGTAIDVVDGAVVDETLSVPTGSLSAGIHRLYVRTKNAANVYSLYEHKTFRVGHTFDSNTSDLVEAEYFFNQDPGVGMGVVIDVVDGTIVDETLVIPTGSLPVDTHRLFVRTKNTAGTYSLYEHKTFRVTHSPDNNTTDIVAAEYFIDVDPGLGAASTLSVSGNVIDENLIATTSAGLAQGDHYLYIRTKNANNEWSLYERQYFEISGVLSIKEELLKLAVKIYPNPVVEKLNIALTEDDKIVSVEMYDLQGKNVYKGVSSELDISHLNYGVYLLILETNKGKLTKKIVKK